MKIYCITLFNMTKGAPTVLADARDLSSFGYFQRGRCVCMCLCV